MRWSPTEPSRTWSCSLPTAAIPCSAPPSCWAAARRRVRTCCRRRLERLLRHWPTIEGNPEGYLRRTLYHLAADRWRQQSVWRRQLRLLRPGLGAAAADPFAEVEQRDSLVRLLRQLPPRQRAAIVARYWEQLSEAESAQVLGCSVGTVKSATARGLRRLRELSETGRAPHDPVEGEPAREHTHMNTELEDRLRSDMEQFTNDVRISRGLALRAYRHNRKRRRVLRVTAASGAAIAVAASAVAIAGASGAFGSAPRPGPERADHRLCPAAGGARPGAGQRRQPDQPRPHRVPARRDFSSRPLGGLSGGTATGSAGSPWRVASMLISAYRGTEKLLRLQPERAARLRRGNLHRERFSVTDHGDLP